MINFEYRLQRSANVAGQKVELDLALQLLSCLKQSANLREAAEMASVSYRKAWNELGRLEQIFGMPLVSKQRGKGTRLAELGKALLCVVQTDEEYLRQDLSRSEIAAQQTIKTVLQTDQVILCASDCEKITRLRQLHLPLKIDITGSTAALQKYADKQCQIAGFHLISGDPGLRQLSAYRRFLQPVHDRYILVQKRRQGLISRCDHSVESIAQLIHQHLRFVNRQQGAATRFLFDYLLQQQGFNADEVTGYHHEEHTHLAVASMVSSGNADVCLGIEQAAQSCNLNFHPLAEEYYFFVFRQLSPAVLSVLNALKLDIHSVLDDFSGIIDLIRQGRHD